MKWFSGFHLGRILKNGDPPRDEMCYNENISIIR
jgi:hypothetical protein